MVKVGLLVRLEAKPGKETAVEDFLRKGLDMAENEPATRAWFAVRFGKSSFGIFDVFPDDSGREAHLSGKLASALKSKTPELFSKPPDIQKIDVVAAKLAEKQTAKV